jgi:hypothetical protein
VLANLAKMSSSKAPNLESLSRNFFASVGKHQSKFKPISEFDSKKSQDKVIRIAVDFFAWYTNDFNNAFERAAEHNVRIKAVLKIINEKQNGFYRFIIVYDVKKKKKNCYKWSVVFLMIVVFEEK